MYLYFLNPRIHFVFCADFFHRSLALFSGEMMGPEIGSPPDAKLTDPLSSSSPSPSLYRSTTGEDTLLDPPSYADAIFRPAAPQNSAGNSTSPYLEITVTDPQKETDNSYITYLITTRLRGAPSPCIVRRRFRHVVALADRLAESRRGFFVPVRPDKGVVEGQVMQRGEFLEQRRGDLERYLRRLAAHPVVGRGEEVAAFLRAEDYGDGVGAVQGGRDLMRVFRELRQSVVNDWGGARGLAEEEDREFLERRGRIQEFGLRLGAASEQVFFGV